MNIEFPSALGREASSPASSSLPIRPGDPKGPSFHQELEEASSKNGKIADAAKQFEALIAGQVLRAVRESSQGGWLGDGDDQTGELTLEMAEQGFAQALAARGSFGIAKIVTAAMARGHSRAANSAPASSVPARPGIEPERL